MRGMARSFVELGRRRCVFCDDGTMVFTEKKRDGGGWTITHLRPYCPEYARYLEGF